MQSIEFNKAQVKLVKKTLGNIKKGAPTVIRRAVNKTATQAKTLASKEIRKVVNLKAKLVGQHIVINRANFKSLTARMKISGKPISLLEYGARQTKTGVSVRVRKGRKIEKHKSHFIAKMKSGHRGVFERRIINGKRAGRLPLDEKVGPSIPAVFQFNAEKQVTLVSAVNLQKNLDHEILYLLSKQ